MAFQMGAVWARTLWRLAIASRYSERAFFSEATAERWISSSTFCTVRSPALGMLAIAWTASGQPGASGGVRADAFRSSSTVRTLSSSRRCNPGYSFSSAVKVVASLWNSRSSRASDSARPASSRTSRFRFRRSSDTLLSQRATRRRAPPRAVPSLRSPRWTGTRAA